MLTFSDTQGRPWTITLNVDAIRRVRDDGDMTLALRNCDLQCRDPTSHSSCCDQFEFASSSQR
jgi:hypothetical protein